MTDLTDWTNYLTPVGAFAGSPGPYGTYDMGGDVFQWNETVDASSYRYVRGGCWDYNSIYMGSIYAEGYTPSDDAYLLVSLRVASEAVPEPGSITLVVCGGLCLLAYAWRRRLR